MTAKLSLCEASGPIFNKCFSEGGIVETESNALTKGLTEMLIQKMTAKLGVGTWAWPGAFMGFWGVGEGCGIVVNDTAATKLKGGDKSGVLCSQPFLCPHTKELCVGGNVWGCPPGLSPCPPAVPWALRLSRGRKPRVGHGTQSQRARPGWHSRLLVLPAASSLTFQKAQFQLL